MTARWDLAAIAATALTVTMTISYLVIVDSQGSDPAYWALFFLVAAASAALYAARRDAPHRLQMLLTAAVLLLALGLASVFSIGLPLVLAAVCLLGSALRRERPAPVQDPGWGHRDDDVGPGQS